MKNITATIITLNEEKNIRDVITSAAAVCDEIVVVDSKSVDNTVAIARSLGAKVIIQEYLGDGPQRIFAAKHTKNDWILDIDADERLEEDAKNTISALDLDHTPYDAFAFKRKTFIGDRWIKLWYPEYVIRLYNKQKTRHRDVRGHTNIETKNFKKLDGTMLHYSYADYADMIQKINRFTTRGADMMREKGKKVSRFTPFTHSLAAFIRKYIFKRGVFYGLDGLTISMLTAMGTYMKYAKYIEILDNKQKNPEKKSVYE